MGSIEESVPKADTDYRGWPNAIGFNATEIHGEVTTPIDLDITGRFPAYVAGSLYRTGPGAYKLPRRDGSNECYTVSHWFDGFTTTHKFDLIAGPDGVCDRVRYRSRLQVDELVEKARSEGKLGSISFGQKRDPCDALYQKFKTFFSAAQIESGPRMRNIGVALREVLPDELASVPAGERRGRRLLTITSDIPFTKQFDADTLESLGVTEQTKIDPALSGPLSAAHSSKDPKTGEIFNYNLAFGRADTYRVWRASASGEKKVLATIKGPGVAASYIHSLSLTDNFVILTVWPAHFRSRGMAIPWERNLLDAMRFDPSAPTTWYVVDRHHGRGLVRTFTSPAMFCFHTTNAWEERRGEDESVDLTCELVEFPNMDILSMLYYENVVSNSTDAGVIKERASKNGEPRLVRYKLTSVPLQGPPQPLTQKRAAEKVMDHIAGDLPVYNPRYTFQPHRYVYSVLDRGKSSFLDGLGKTDTQTGELLVWEREHHTPGEPIFVGAPDAADEDDGVLLSVVLDGDAGTSYLLCLDAKTLAELGRAAAPVAVGFGFHGLHLPQRLSSL